MNRFTLFHIIPILFCAFFITTNRASAQHCKFYELTYKDSIIAAKESNLISNNIRLSNIGHKTVRLSLQIDIPSNWKNVAKNNYLDGSEVFYNLSPGQQKNIPLNLLKLPKSAVGWDSVRIVVRLRELSDSHVHYCVISAAPNPRFAAEPITEDLNLLDKPEKEIPLSISLKNTGNIPDVYSVNWKTRGAESFKSISLLPGQDTILTYGYHMPFMAWSDFDRDDILFTIKSATGNIFSHTFAITKSKRVIKKEKYAYAYLPVTLEAGALNYGSVYTYFIGARGNLQFGERNNLDFSYRSKQIGKEVYGLQRDMFMLDYTYHKWKFGVGQVSAPQNFFISNGRGASVSYKPDMKSDISLTANFKDHNFFYNSNTFSLGAKYPIGKFSMIQSAAADFNDVTGINGYAISNDVQLVNNTTTALSVKAGGGLEQNTKAKPNQKETAAGFLGGYAFSHRIKKWAFISSINYYSNDVPGSQKGMSIQQHQLSRIVSDKISIGINYSYNRTKTRFYRDTLYNTDVLKTNSTQYGLVARYLSRKQAVSFYFGSMKTVSQSNGGGTGNPYFLDVSYSWVGWRKSFINFAVQNAYTPKSDLVKSPTLSNVISLTTKVKFAGVAGAYTRTPIPGDAINGNKTRYQETINGGPYIDFNVFRGKLKGNIKYSFAKSLYDNDTRTYAAANISYSLPKFGLDLTANGNMPLNKAQISGTNLPISESKTFTISLIKQLNVPVLTKRKYVSMKQVVYFDENNNGKKDEKEEGLPNVRIDISEAVPQTNEEEDFDDNRTTEPIYTNRKGEARYLNAKKGNYILDLSNAEIEGLVPSMGLEQTIKLQENKLVEIPFKKGKVVKGNIKITLDSFSNAKLTPDYIKVTATDSAGEKHPTLSDAKGDFFFNLPAGKYTISLNPDAFESSDFKPERTSYEVDLTDKETAYVQFHIKQKKRKIRYLEQK